MSSIEAGAAVSGSGGRATMMCCNPSKMNHGIDFQETTGIYLPEMQLEGLAQRAPWIAASPSRQRKSYHQQVAQEEAYMLSMGSMKEDELHLDGHDDSFAVGLKHETAEVNADRDYVGEAPAASGVNCCGCQSGAVNVDGSEMDLNNKQSSSTSPVKLHYSNQRFEGNISEKMASDYLAPPRSPMEVDSSPASPPKAGASITYAREANLNSKMMFDSYTGARSRSEIIVTQPDEKSKKGPSNSLLACCQQGANYGESSLDEGTTHYGQANGHGVGERMADEYVRPNTEGLPIELRKQYHDPTVNTGAVHYAKDHPAREGKSPMSMDTDPSMSLGGITKTRHDKPVKGVAKPADQSTYGVAKPAGRPAYGVAKPADRPAYGVAKPAGRPAYGVAKPADQPTYGVAKPADQAAYGVAEPADQSVDDVVPARTREMEFEQVPRKVSSSTGTVDQPQSATDMKQGPSPHASPGAWGLFKICCDPTHAASPPETWSAEADRQRQLGQIDVDRAEKWPGMGNEQNEVLINSPRASSNQRMELDETEPNQFKALDYMTRPPEEVYNIRDDGTSGEHVRLPEYTGKNKPHLAYSKDYAKGGWTTSAVEHGEMTGIKMDKDARAATTDNRTTSKGKVDESSSIMALCCNASKSQVDEGDGPYRLTLPGDSSIADQAADGNATMLGPYIGYRVSQGGRRSFEEAQSKPTYSNMGTKSQMRAAGAALSLVKAPNTKGGCSFQASDKATFIAKMDGMAFYKEVIAPAATSADHKQTWESHAYELVHPERESLWIKYVLGDDGLIRGHLMAPDTEEYRNCAYDCSFICVSGGERNPKLYSDSYVAFSGSQTILLKEEEGLALEAQRIVRDQSWAMPTVMMHVTTARCRCVAGGDLRSDFETMYRSEVYNAGPVPVADVTVVCEKEVVPASRAVLIARSKVFAQMLSSKSKAVVVVTGAPPLVVKNLVDYMHSDRCELLSSAGDLAILLKLFETSVRFAVPALMNELVIRLVMTLNSDTVSQIEVAAHRTRHAFLIEAVNQYRSSHP